MTSIPDLYLKWRAFRSLIGDARSDADIARTIFEDHDGPIKFSKLLYGDYGCRLEIGGELVGVINRCISAHRKATGLAAEPARKLTTGDLSRPVYEFSRRLIEAAEVIDPDRLNGAHHQLFAELVPGDLAKDTGPRLTIERYSLDRAFTGMCESGGSRPLTFEPGRHSGQFVIEGVERDPVAVYVMVARDPGPTGLHLWDQTWGETVLWLPSPFRPAREDNALRLMPRPQPVLPMPGRFVATAVLVHDEKTVTELDPRGGGAPPAALDEQQTARFLTNMRRLANRKTSRIVVTRGEYLVVAGEPAAASTNN